MRTSLWFVVGLAVLCAACSSEPEDRAEPTAAFAADLRQASDALVAGESVALSETTDFDWDSVYFFAAGTRRSAINESVGFSVYDSDLDERVGIFNDDFLAVFTRDGSLVGESTVPSYFSVLDEQLDESSATVSKSTSPAGGEVITITRQAP